MKKLIAKRTVLYLGRMYAPGEALPANNQTMVDAWLRAESAGWSGAAPVKPAADGQENAGAPPAGAGMSQDPQEGNGPEAAQENGQEPEMVTGHLDAAELAKMKKPDLEDLAEKLGVDISGAKNNQERAELIAAVPVLAPADENGSAQ